MGLTVAFVVRAQQMALPNMGITQYNTQYITQYTNCPIQSAEGLNTIKMLTFLHARGAPTACL